MKKNSLDILHNLILKLPELEITRKSIKDSIELLIECYHKNGKVLVCGNGGSAADAEHIVGELMKGFLLPRRIDSQTEEKIRILFEDDSDYLINNLQQALPTISLVSQTALQTAFANDKAPDLSFAQQVYGYGNKGDVFIAISTSGNSKNIIYAAQIARCIDMKVIALTGSTGGKLKSLSDIIINVPADETYIVQEYHLPVYHAICACLENEFFGI